MNLSSTEKEFKDVESFQDSPISGFNSIKKYKQFNTNATAKTSKDA
jgi:hypothetical protein